eukprot:PhF_6_TR697/c0_g1_i2/m.1126
MEYIPGASLAQEIACRRDDFGNDYFTGQQIAAVFTRILLSVRELHMVGIVHGDLKPGNIMIREKEVGVESREVRVKLIDLGCARISGENAHNDECCFHGTPHYMAPEKISHPMHASIATDLWALGVTLYEMMTLQKPFQGDNEVTLRRSVHKGLLMKHNIPVHHKSYHADLIRVVMKLLMVNPEERCEHQGIDTVSWILTLPLFLQHVLDWRIFQLFTSLSFS